MTIPCGLLLFFVLPDLPSNCKVWYLSEEEKAFALDRAIRNGKGQPTGKVDMALLKRTFSRWRKTGSIHSQADELLIDRTQTGTGLCWDTSSTANHAKRRATSEFGSVGRPPAARPISIRHPFAESENFSVSARNVIPSCGALINIVSIFMVSLLLPTLYDRFNGQLLSGASCRI
jgi:ACS family pantothenate transporter-like MFS transporter